MDDTFPTASDQMLDYYDSLEYFPDDESEFWPDDTSTIYLYRRNENGRIRAELEAYS